MNKTDQLAREITKKSGLETYYIIKFLADKHKVNDAYKAYAYFRWLDDQIDENLKNRKDKQKFIKRQKTIIELSYRRKKPAIVHPQERMITELIENDSKPNSKLKSYIMNFFSIIAFDAGRKDKIIPEKKLNWYSETIGKAATDCILYFIGNNISYTESTDQYKAASAAHIVHSLRDLKHDLKTGYINIPKEFLEKNKSDITNISDYELIPWVKNRTGLAKRYFESGKKYIKKLPNPKCKLAAILYCLRFEPLIFIIEKDKYILRENYNNRLNIMSCLKTAVAVLSLLI